jgi:lauroyl/myristoyl acyltransferase
MPDSGRAVMPGDRLQSDGTLASAPRWVRHSYNRATFYHLAAGFGWLPRPARLSAARLLGRLALRVLPAERAAAQRTLHAVTGATGASLHALTARLFGEFAMCFADLVSTNRGDAAALGRHVESVVGAEHLDEIQGGAVSVTAHVGNWELAGRLLATQRRQRTHIVVTPDEAPALGRWVRRDGDGVRFVPRSHPAIGLTLVKALRRGEMVALQGDRAIGTRGDVALPFFGRPAAFPLGPFILAGAAGVPVVAAFCMLGASRRYTVRLEPPIVVERGQEEAAARTWVAMLERIVGAHPTQWFNFFDIWRPFGT